MGSRGGRKKQSWSHQPLNPLMEGPDGEMQQEEITRKKEMSSWREWFRSSPPAAPPAARQDLRLVLGVLACPLVPIPTPPAHHHHPPLVISHAPLETRTAHYIIQQYVAATGWSSSKQRKNMYTAGSVNMTCCQTEVAGTPKMLVPKGSEQREVSGCFVVWQMSPGMWSLELVVGGCKVAPGSDSNIVWRHTPWLGTHAAKGPQRPLRRIVQGMDPKATASLFATSPGYLGEKRIGEEDCFVIKVAADRESVMERNEGPGAEVIRHVLYGYFSQRTGLLVYLEDSHLTRVLLEQPPPHQTYMDCPSESVYWETTIGSSIGDYMEVDGVLIAHQGRTVATVFRFGESSSHHCRTTMEELWSIKEVVFVGNEQELSAVVCVPVAAAGGQDWWRCQGFDAR